MDYFHVRSEYHNKAPVWSASDLSWTKEKQLHLTPIVPQPSKGKISVEGEHILQCDVDLVSSPPLHGLCFLC